MCVCVCRERERDVWSSIGLKVISKAKKARERSRESVIVCAGVWVFMCDYECVTIDLSTYSFLSGKHLRARLVSDTWSDTMSES